MKTTISTLSLITLSILLLFSSCKKEDSEKASAGYISFTMNGVEKIFKEKAISISASQVGANTIAFNAYQDKTSEESFYIQIIHGSKKIMTGTYVDPGPDDDNLFLIAAYRPATDDPEKGFSAGLQEVDDPNPRLTITINTLSSKKVTGTFTGTFYNNDGEGPGKLIISGKFDLPFYDIPR
ncbi:MAG: hypothetical protein ABI123_05585 [Ginsengibacter sp.]